MWQSSHRVLLLLIGILASVLFLVEERFGSRISPGQESAVLAAPAIEVLDEADSELVTFDASPKEQEVVRRLYADELNQRNQFSGPPGGTDILVAVVDLTPHGRKGIVAYFQRPDFCGQLGCRVVVLIWTPDSYWKEVLVDINRYAVRVSKHITHGLRDILFERHTGSYEVWRWDGERYQWSGKIIQQETTLPERKWSDTDRQRLRVNVGTYASEDVIWDPAVRARLQRLLGPVELDNLASHIETRGPVGLVNGVLFVEGNLPHWADRERGLLAIDLQTGSVYAGLWTEDYIRIYIRDERIPREPSRSRRAFTSLPLLVQEWALGENLNLGLNSYCPCPKPDDVELRFGRLEAHCAGKATSAR